jgi:hypothetical protein
LNDVELLELEDELELLDLLELELLLECPLGHVCAAVATAEPFPPPNCWLDDPLLELDD